MSVTLDSIKDYKGIYVPSIQIVRNEELIDARVNELLSKVSVRELEAGENVSEGDELIISYSLDVDGSKVSVDDCHVVIGSGVHIEELEQRLIGQAVGDSTSLKITFPDPHIILSLSGKTKDVTCDIKQAVRHESFEADDKYVASVSEFETLAELREAVAMQMDEVDRLYIRSSQNDHICNALCELAVVSGVDEEVSARLHSDHLLGSDGEHDLDDDLEDELAKELAKDIKLECIVSYIADKEGIEVTEDEIASEINDIANTFGADAEASSLSGNPKAKALAAKALLREKVIDFVLSNSTDIPPVSDDAEQVIAGAVI